MCATIAAAGLGHNTLSVTKSVAPTRANRLLSRSMSLVPA